MKRDIKFFGVFRQHMRNASLELEASPNMTAKELKGEIKLALKDVSSDLNPNLVEISALSTDKIVLRDTESIGQASTLYLLPPVCGG